VFGRSRRSAANPLAEAVDPATGPFAHHAGGDHADARHYDGGTAIAGWATPHGAALAPAVSLPTSPAAFRDRVDQGVSAEVGGAGRQRLRRMRRSREREACRKDRSFCHDRFLSRGSVSRRHANEAARATLNSRRLGQLQRDGPPRTVTVASREPGFLPAHGVFSKGAVMRQPEARRVSHPRLQGPATRFACGPATAGNDAT
jgi:hypothetical protein